MGKWSKYNEQKNEYKRAFRAKQKARAEDYLGGKCASCGSKDRLEFDHINDDRESAKHCVTAMIDLTWSSLVAELDKCQLLCNGCHWDKTREDKGYGRYTHGTATSYRMGCRCDECRSEQSKRYKEYYYRTKQLSNVE